MNKQTVLKMCSWGLAVIVLALALGVWAHNRLAFGGLTTYKLFPILGLSAFSLMWTHYIVGALRRILKQDKKVVKLYSSVTGAVVLALILFHPGLLWYQLWRDGLGLPPKSYLHAYPSTGMHIALMLGSISLLIFLAFELKHHFEKKSWWKLVDYAQIAAMFFIFYHALTLGQEVAHGWFRVVWYFYGLSLLAAVVYNYAYDRKPAK